MTGAHVTSWGVRRNDSVADMHVQAAERNLIIMKMTLNEEID